MCLYKAHVLYGNDFVMIDCICLFALMNDSLIITASIISLTAKVDLEIILQQNVIYIDGREGCYIACGKAN